MNIDNYDSIWRTQIKPALTELEGERQKAYKQRIWMGVSGFGLVVMGVMAEADLGLGLWSLAPLGLLIVGALAVYYYRNDYSKRFKQGVFDAIAGASDIDWDINPRNADTHLLDKTDSSLETTSDAETGRITMQESKLYPGHSNIGVDDVIVGKSNQQTIPVWETTVTEGHGRNTRTVFSGFFLRLSIDHSFDGETYVRTESDDISDLGEDQFMGIGSDLQAVELEWSDFERFLEVKSSSQTEAREIFTPDFMQVLYDWWRKHNHNYRFAFHGQSIYIAFPTKEDLEPSVSGSLQAQKDNIKEIFDFVAFLEVVVDLTAELEISYNQ
jgi:hypothetical protein